jgi:hypothetical protein
MYFMKKIKFKIRKELKLKLQEMNLILGSGGEPLPPTGGGGGCSNCEGVCEVTCSSACSTSCVTRCKNGCGNVINV